MAKSKPFHSTEHTVFHYNVTDMPPDTTVNAKVTLTAYCNAKFVSKRQAREWIKKGWLLATRSGKHIYVWEACPEEIAAYY